jgi:hypothetical protein
MSDLKIFAKKHMPNRHTLTLFFIFCFSAGKAEMKSLVAEVYYGN